MKGKKNIRSFLLLLCFVSFVIAIGLVIRRSNTTHAKSMNGSKPGLVLYCGAGIRSAAEAVIASFESNNDLNINVTYGGGGRLLGQISSIRKGDLFMPGSDLYVDIALEKGLAVAQSEKNVAYFIPVILVAKGNPKGVKTLTDLGREGIRVGLGDERSCAVGRVSAKIFKKNNIDEELLKDNIVYKSGTVNELGLAVQLGNVDAVILWDANARDYEQYGDIVQIPREDNLISNIPIVILKSSKHFDEAEKFVDFITSVDGKKILEKEGYTVDLGDEYQ